MTSKSLSQNAFLNPDIANEESIQEEKSYRRATVYDAVAGTGYISTVPVLSLTPPKDASLQLASSQRI
jgi:hypothetical protein